MKKRKSRKIIVVIIIILLIAGGLWACKGMGQEAINPVEVIQPQMGSVEELVSVSGTVESEEIKTYFAPVNGELLEISVQPGDVVKAGDMLVTYNMDEMEEILEQARLQYISGNNSYNDSLADNTDAQKKLKDANTQLAILEQQIKNQKAYVKDMHAHLTKVQTERADALAEKDLEMQKKLMELQANPIENEDAILQLQLAIQSNQYASQKVTSTEDLIEYQKSITVEEEKLAEYEQKKAEMEAQKQSAELGMLTDYQKDNLSVSEQINLMTYENAKEDYELAMQGVTADFDGIVTEVTAIDGMFVAENTQLLTLANSNAVKVSFSVSKYDLARLALGQTAEIEICGNTYTGSIAKINRMAITGLSGSAMVGAEIHIDNPDENIYIGLDAKVRIHAGKAENVLLIPIEALNADKKGDFVYVEENGLVVRKDVVTGISSTEYIEVKEGLCTEDKVIVSYLTALEEGAPVVSMSDAATE